MHKHKIDILCSYKYMYRMSIFIVVSEHMQTHRYKYIQKDHRYMQCSENDIDNHHNIKNYLTFC